MIYLQHYISYSNGKEKELLLSFFFWLLYLLQFWLVEPFPFSMGPILCRETPKNRAYSIEATQKFARLAPLPKSVTNIETEIVGSAFERTFVVIFEAPKDDIKEWLKSSPGTQGIIPKKLANGSLEYSILEGDGGKLLF